MTTCKSCGASIVFARTRGDRLMPVDADAQGAPLVFTPGGNVALEFKDDEWHAEVGHGPFIAHFVTCPNADQHRKKR